jgi:hypothetical protein
MGVPMSSPISSSSSPLDSSSSNSSKQTSINEFYKVITIELPIGGNDSINRIRSIYEDMKKEIPDYKYEDLELLLELKNNGKAFTTAYRKLKEKIYDSCKEALK